MAQAIKGTLSDSLACLVLLATLSSKQRQSLVVVHDRMFPTDTNSSSGVEPSFELHGPTYLVTTNGVVAIDSICGRTHTQVSRPHFFMVGRAVRKSIIMPFK